MNPPPRLRLALLLSLLSLLASPSASTATPLQVPLFRPDTFQPIPTLLRGVDDVAPAFANATEAALIKAQLILGRYSNTLRIIAIPTGLAVTFFGYFLLAPVLFIAAFISGGGACFVAVNAIIGDDTPAAAWIAIAAMVLGGALLGFLALRALNFGMFAVGAALGVILASALKTSLVAQAYPKDPEVAFYVAAAVCALLFGTLAVCLQKQMLIFSTAYAGSCACAFGIGHFAGHFPTTTDITNAEKGNLDVWVLFYILLTVALGTAGMFFQFWLGKGKPMPTHAPHDRRRRRRRVRQHDIEGWSDADDEWADEVYAERVPLPRAKHEPVARPDLQADIRSNELSFKADQMPLPRRSSYSQHSWNNVRSATSAFDDDDSAHSSDPANGKPGEDGAAQSKQVDTPVVLSPEPEPVTTPPMVKEPELLPETSVAVNEGSDIHPVPKNDELMDFGAGVYDQVDSALVHVSLESDAESPNKQ